MNRKTHLRPVLYISLMLVFNALTSSTLHSQCQDDPNAICIESNYVDFAGCGLSCSGKDVQLLDLYVLDPQGVTCPSCVPGEQLTWDLFAVVENNTSATRGCVSVYSNILANGMQCCVLSLMSTGSCLGPNETATIHMGQFTFNCGDVIVLSDLVVSWEIANGQGCSCDPIECPSSAKCDYVADITLKTPLGGYCESTPVECIGGTGTATMTAGGGTPPYSYEWRDVGGSLVGTSSSITAIPGEYTVLVSDVESCEYQCTTTIELANDSEPPIAICMNIAIDLDPTGNASIQTSDIDNGSVDNCGIDYMTLSQTNFSCADVGENTVVLTVYDLSGNSAACNAMVNVNDVTPPVAICQNVTIQLDASGNATITETDIDNGSSDECGIRSLTLDRTSFTCADLGTNTVSLTVTDLSGNESTCTATVTCLDNVAPTVVCPANIVVNNDPGACGATVTYATTFDDNCSALASYDPPSGSFFSINTTSTVNVEVADESGNTTTCSFTVTVNDAVAPSISCPTDITVSCEDDTTPSGTGTASSTDPCGGAPGSITHSDNVVSGACPNEYTIERTWTATDPDGNSSECVQIITVIDDTPPTITCPAGATYQCIGDVPAANTALVTATDNCLGAIEIAHVNDVITGFKPQILTRTYSATDACDNVSSCQQIFTILNSEPPLLTCPSDLAVECFEDVPPVDISTVEAIAVCGGSVTVAHLGDEQVGSCPITITRTYQGVDNFGNTSTCSQVITVNDTTPPATGICLSEIDLGCSTIEPTLGSLPLGTADPGILLATDNCTPSNELVLTYVDEGPTIEGCVYTFIRTYTVTDGCGNSSVCDPQPITFIYDITPPVFTDVPPSDLSFQCNEPVPPIPPTPTATDDCYGIVQVLYTEQEGTSSCLYFSIERTWIAIDGCGNSTVYTQTVSMQDSTAPEIVHSGDTTIQCGEDIPEPHYEIIESCEQSRVHQEFREEIIPGECACDYTILRIWDVYNGCYAMQRDTQFIYVVDTLGPDIEVVNPMLGELQNEGTMKMFSCEQPRVQMNDIITDDCCGVANIRLYDSLLAYETCEAFEYFALWVCGYEVTDHCGNISTFRFYVEQYDTVAPVLSGNIPLEPLIEVECGYTVPKKPDVIAIDQCSVDPTLSYHADTVGFFPDSFAIVRTWSTMDNCGNASSFEQVVSYCEYEIADATGIISGNVWLDSDGDGIRNNEEHDIAGIVVALYRDLDKDHQPDSLPMKVSATDTRGKYQFTLLAPGKYFVKIIPGNHHISTQPSDASGADMISMVDPISGFSGAIIVGANERYDVYAGLNNLDDEIVLVDFRGRNEGCTNKLSWTVGSERDVNVAFSLEKSYGGVDFKRIAVVLGNTKARDFSFEDTMTGKRAHYRLSWEKADGTTGGSDTIMLSSSCVKLVRYEMFPNPTKGMFSLKFDNEDSIELSAKIVDVYGKAVKTWQISGTSHHLEDVDTDLIKGMYYVIISDGVSQISKPLVILGDR